MKRKGSSIKKFTIKNFSIKNQMAIIFALIVIVTMGFATMYLPYYFRKTMENTFFNTIKAANKPLHKSEISDDIYAVQQLLLGSDGEVKLGFSGERNRYITPTFLEEIKARALEQTEQKDRYIIDTEDVRVYCVIDKFFQGYKVSFMFDVYGENFMIDMVKQLSILLIILVVLGIVVMYVYSNYLVNRMIKIKGKVEKIADGDWSGSLKVDENDELSVLSNSIEDMRIKLIEQDKYRNDMYQSISHDLKTPIMIINTYAQSIKDGMYPEGDLEDTTDAIIEESQKLDEKVKRILLINKLNYLKSKNETFDKVNMKEIIECTVNRLDKLKNIEFQLELEDVFYEGECDKWCTAIENIISNNLRYAKSIIKIKLSDEGISIFNDGPLIEFQDENNIFQIYSKGKSGQTGIGLYITKTIVELFHCSILVHNLDNGVEFKIIPDNN